MRPTGALGELIAVPYGTDLHIMAFQAFHARLPSFRPFGTTFDIPFGTIV